MDATTTTKAAPNPWKANRRALKVQRIVEALDMALTMGRITLPEAQLDSVSSMNDAAWACCASVAGVNLPSLETRWAVVRVYEARVRAAVDAALAQAIAGALARAS